MIKRLVVAFLYGDLFERVVYRTRPYETEKRNEFGRTAPRLAKKSGSQCPEWFADTI